MPETVESIRFQQSLEDKPMNRNSNAVIAGLLLCLSVAVAAFAIDFAESVDFPGGVSFATNPSIGTLTLGANTVSGSLAGNCVVGDCNGGAAGDTQDSLLFTVPSGFQVTSLTVTTSSVTGPAGFTVSMELRSSTATVQSTPFLSPLPGTTPNLLSSPFGAGEYALSVYGQGATEAGPYSLNWLVTMSLAAVGSFPTVTPTAPATSSLCSPTVPASISGSTGAQGVLDPTNTIPPDQPNGGLIWPGAAAVANVFLDTGDVVFTDAGGAVVGSATLPGVSSFPAFFDGRLHFGRVNLPAGKGMSIAVNAATTGSFTAFTGKAPPAVVLSCGDVILETGSVLAVGVPIDGPPVFGGAPVVFPGAFAGGGAATNLPAAGFGPRSGSGAAAGAIYPSMGGAGGGSGSAVVNCGLGVDCPSGGFGGGALVLVAAQRVRIDGTIYAVGTNAVPGNPGAAGGGGGSVRIAGTLVEGTGVIDTSGGAGSVNGANGPIEIQAFVQDVFTGTATGSVRGNPVAAPLPSNLPSIQIVEVSVSGVGDFCGFECSNTGSLLAPDVTLPDASSPVLVTVRATTGGAPEGSSLVFRAVGTDGSVAEATAVVPAGCGIDCFPPPPAVDLLLNPGATYQIVVTPSAAFPLAREPQAVPMRGPVQLTGLREGSEGADLAARWARALGADPRTLEAQVARMTVKLGSSE
jgi:hypothetical protein